MKRIKSKIAIAKQNVMEKTSSRENTLEPEEMKELEKQVAETRTYVRKLTKSIEKETVSTGVSIQDGTELADNFIDYSVHVRDNYPDLVVLSGILSKIGEFQAGFEDLKAKLNSSLINDVSDPLKSLVKTELKQAQIQKKEYDKSRIAYDASLSELANIKKLKNVKPNKIQEQEDDTQKLGAEFGQVGNETAQHLRDVNMIAEFEAVEKLCDYLDSYYTFFQKGYRWLAQKIPDIYEYRLYVEKRKAELEKSKVRMSMLLTPKPDDLLKNKVFGEDLSVLTNRDQSSIPIFVARAFAVIRSRLTEEGLFRLSGTKRLVLEMKQTIDEGKEYNLQDCNDVHVTPKCKMGPANLATCVGPNILVSQVDIIVEDIALGNTVITTIIQNFERIFGGAPSLENISLVHPTPPQQPQVNATQPSTLSSSTTSTTTTTAPQKISQYKSPSFNNNHPAPGSSPPAIYNGVPMRNRNLSSSGSTLGDSFDDSDAIALTDEE
ncbi:RhoGAP domain-containing protein [Cavenderia fasciculata]|uniref:RhoGAP domain-containing protein n=1 Tax=Cavenderia fasciculata TaxID=261658 RepID=F4PRL9_CACFS|nr:RhoGAP domain-containing protein [Cavenderia fasciculata]EGG21359.1 RhoGAP domain-containing protein [Cavenderia fasciculata]|eukprot:XP_004359209.1 RhoGAP domain-containing protein [Cavenderia fasciculata]